MRVDCQFYDYSTSPDKKFYICFIELKEIPADLVLDLVGQHVHGKSNDDVTEVQFKNCTVTKVPQGLTKIFKNMKILEIWNSKLKSLSRPDLVEYKNLKGFRFDRNELDFLPGDLFEDFKNLELISFYGNKLELIEPNILDGLRKLKFVEFRENPNYDKWFFDNPLYDANATLQEVKDDLREKFVKSVPLLF